MLSWHKRFIVFVRQGILQVHRTHHRHINPRVWFNVAGTYAQLSPDLFVFGETLFPPGWTPPVWFTTSWGDVLGDAVVLGVDWGGFVTSLSARQVQRLALVSTAPDYVPKRLQALPCGLSVK